MSSKNSKIVIVKQGKVGAVVQMDRVVYLEG